MVLATAFEIVDQRDGKSTRSAPLYHYYFARRKPQYLGSVTMRQALRATAVNGFCRLDLHDKLITVSGALEEPSQPARNHANGRRLLAYDPNTGTAGYFKLDRNDRLKRWKSTLSQGFPVIAADVTQSATRAATTPVPDSAGFFYSVPVRAFVSLSGHAKATTNRQSYLLPQFGDVRARPQAATLYLSLNCIRRQEL